MFDYRKAIIAVIIGVLFAIFVQTSIEAVYQSPSYYDFCDNNLRTPFDKEEINETEVALYNAEQERCNNAYRAADDHYGFVVFLVSAVLGLLAIVVALFWSASSTVGMAVSAGLLLGGLFTLFFGTMRGWGGIGLQIRPFVILLQLIVVIVISYMKLNNPKKKK